MSTDCSQVFYEKAALETSEKFTGKQLKSSQALVCNYTKKGTPSQLFLYEFGEMFEGKIFSKHP